MYVELIHRAVYRRTAGNQRAEQLCGSTSIDFDVTPGEFQGEDELFPYSEIA